MFRTNRQELFSSAFVIATAAKVGCNLARLVVDDDSVDCSLSYIIENKPNSRPQIDIQMKCTKSIDEDENNYKFNLKIKNYNDLRITTTYTQRILLVILIPYEENEWMRQTTEELLLKKCGYWTSIRGFPETSNTSTVTVSIPKSNIFTPDALLTLMTMVANGEYI